MYVQYSMTYEQPLVMNILEGYCSSGGNLHWQNLSGDPIICSHLDFSAHANALGARLSYSNIFTIHIQYYMVPHSQQHH